MSATQFQALLLGREPRLAETLIASVRLNGGTLNAVTSCADALKFLQSYLPDVIFLDLKSAEAEALDLLRQFKQNPPPPVFTFGLEPASENPAALRAFELGLDEFIQTPFENNLFQARLDAGLRHKRKLEEFLRRQRELTEAHRNAEAKSRAKSDFLATMSHEIRTPMNGVIAMTGLLMETGLTLDQRGYLDTIYSSSESLLNIINDILDFSKIEAGKMELERRTFNLRSDIEESLDLLAPRALEKNLDTAYMVAEVIPELVEGDAQRLRQVLMNLIGNALKFTERGGVLVKVEKLTPLTIMTENPQTLRLHFSVQDTGIGIQPERLARLFRPFAQADASTSRKYGGTGLGLVISRRLVELMAGRMWAESIPGEGSTFHFTVNLAAQENSLPPAHARSQPRLASLKILILEDSSALRNLLSEQCRQWGMQPQAVENPAQARVMLNQNPAFDLMLVDADLPGGNATAMAVELQEFLATVTTPVVLLTAFGKIDNLAGAQIALMHTVGKPVKPGQLCVALERALLSSPAPVKTTEPVKPEALLAQQLPLRILLVDDNLINQKVAVRILQQMGYQPELAGNGCEALAAIERAPVDLIFMDVMMPEMDGLEATRHIRKKQTGGGHIHYATRIIIIAMTAHAMQGDREKCLASGMDDYLPKPVRPKEVRAMVEKWAGQMAVNFSPSCEPAVTEPATEPPVDMSRMTDLTDGNLENLRELVEMYFNQTQKQFGQLREAIRAGQTDQVRRVAHSCAGASATLGMTHLVPQLRELEKLGASGSLTGASGICDNAVGEFARIREFLSAQPTLTTIINNLNPA